MKKISLTILILLVIASTFSCAISFNKIRQVKDSYKKETITYLEQKTYARSLYKKNIFQRDLFTFLTWKNITNNNSKNNHLSLKLTLSPDKRMGKYLFIKLDDSIYKIPADSIHYSNFKGVNTDENIKISKKDSTKTVSIDRTQSAYNYNKITYIVLITDELINKIIATKEISIRFYINKIAKTITLSKPKVKKIKLLFQQMES